MTTHECIVACHALALSGHLEAAKENLRRNRQCLECFEGIDLLARIELKLGNENEAHRLWREALKLCGDASACKTPLEALDHVEWRYRRAVHFLKYFLRFVAFIVLGFFIGRSCCADKDINEHNIVSNETEKVQPLGSCETPSIFQPESQPTNSCVIQSNIVIEVSNIHSNSSSTNDNVNCNLEK